ncbi:alpha/beta hydrolase [Thermoflexus sp.]|uniref:alpha/beta hydrolase n=1 Tax=Thermoflexus sp. TaxID=1969742 RepID=UPI0025CBAA8D|nr:alpha/beta hydrolase [Thermoflexus sp.]MDW8180167.1 alpha/beta hydrolase [Anaerolineae bacterium]MCS6965083.1 alpha/beta hydrolase [Thermoflexus sp.]MCS7350716.1 alpha/beta hydrolase [Thermoflexus sp.]MCX7691553.1 alpha/beta hydrolase [Thermoflexus sp.]MDW8185322.1 alpha/beta hydrolase [Anaerolineae bacterium]
MSETLEFVHRYEPGEDPETLLLLHGTGGDETDLLPLGRHLAPRAGRLAPRGRVLENGMPRFFRRLAPGIFDEADLRRQVADLVRFLGAAAKRYGFDPARVWAVGYSNGANMAAALLLLYPEALRGAVLLRPVLPLRPKAEPDLRGRAVLILAGERDPWAPREQVEALAWVLEAAGASVTLRWHPDGHAMASEEIAIARDWLQRWL